MKKSIYSVLGLSLLFILTSCSVGYVESEPSYVEVSRPTSPSPNYIWINGDWVWSNNVYVHQDGYWVKPQSGRTYQQGYWSKGKKGHHWNNGRWH